MLSVVPSRRCSRRCRCHRRTQRSHRGPLPVPRPPPLPLPSQSHLLQPSPPPSPRRRFHRHRRRRGHRRRRRIADAISLNAVFAGNSHRRDNCMSHPLSYLGSLQREAQICISSGTQNVRNVHDMHVDCFLQKTEKIHISACTHPSGNLGLPNAAYSKKSWR